MKIKEIVLRKYAALVVTSGVNIQKGQLLVIQSPLHCADFARLCAEEAYKVGAKSVSVQYMDEKLERIHALNAAVEVLKRVPQWALDKKQDEIDQKCAYLYLDSSIPDVLKGTDSKKLQEVMMEKSKAFHKFQYYTSNNEGQWCIAAIPNPAWAKKVFPQLEEEAAMEKLWDSILQCVYVTEENDPIEVWKKHSAEIRKHCEAMNECNFKALHFKNSVGTDLVVELVPDHLWGGGMEKTQGGVSFNPNMPTEEVFTMPRKTGVNGVVYATKPLNYQGKLIEGFKLTFKEGKVVESSAKENQDALKNLLELDEGSCYLGEVALISYDSPINNTGILFYDTLFDENASCHLALGHAFPMNLKGGEKMTEEELKAHGYNSSMTHVDFMFGSADMEIEGILQDGSTKQVFLKGSFVF